MNFRGCIAGFVLLFAIVGVVSAGLWYAIHRTSSIVRDAYASDWSTDFLLLHLQANDYQWPKSWEDLRDEHASRYPKPCPFTFKEIQDRVDLRFDIDTETIAQSEPPVVFFRLKSGISASYGGDPNERVKQYFEEQERRSSIED